jgi:glycerate dehydrogenase
MKIVVLDGYTLNPGDLSWQALEALGECDIYDHTTLDQVVNRCHEADIVLTNKTLLSAETLKQLPRLTYIGVLATGTNVVDVEAATEQGISVTNIPAYGPDAVAQMVFAHILHHHQQVALHNLKPINLTKRPNIRCCRLWRYWPKSGNIRRGVWHEGVDHQCQT